MGASLFILAAPAVAAPSGETIVTFDVTAGSLGITVPAGPVDLGSAPPGDTLTGELGEVSVSDTRGGEDSVWVARAYGSIFTSGALEIPPTAISYWSGEAITSAGGGTFTAGQPAVGDAVPLGFFATPITVFSHSGGTGGSTATWNPNLILRIPITAQVGTYTGTVGHSVA